MTDQSKGNKMRNVFKVSALVFGLMGSLLFLTSCETEKDNKIAQAQACLDSATTSSDATLCAQKVDGIEDPRASLVRCGVTYLQQGFVTSKFTNAYQQLKTPPTGTDSTLAMVAYLAFTSTNPGTGRTNTADASYVSEECKKSGSAGLTWLSSSTNIATTLYAIGGVTADDPSSFQTALNGLDPNDPNDDATFAAIGNAALSAYNSQCNGTSAAGTAACTEFEAAVANGGGDPTAIGEALRTRLLTP